MIASKFLLCSLMATFQCPFVTDQLFSLFQVYMDGSTTMAVHERKASISQFYRESSHSCALLVESRS
jgi:hypothetical protein